MSKQAAQKRQIFLTTFLCTITFLFVFYFTLYIELLWKNLEAATVKSRISNEQPVGDSDALFRSLLLKSSAAPISELYQPGFDVDPAPCLGDGSGMQLVVVVHSSHENEEKRKAIRHTWGSLSLRRDTVVVFLLGTSLDETLSRKVQEESQTYGDIIVSRNVELYSSLALKTVAMLEWVSRRCSKAKFFLKSDDDVFLNVPRLLEFLRSPEATTASRTVFGGVEQAARPPTTNSEKYLILPEEYPGNTYLDFVQGACYLATGDLSRKLYKTALQEKFFKAEDNLMLPMTKRIGATWVTLAKFYGVANLMKKSPDNVDDVDSCAIRDKLVIHFVYYEQMFRLWQSVFDRTLKC